MASKRVGFTATSDAQRPPLESHLRTSGRAGGLLPAADVRYLRGMSKRRRIRPGFPPDGGRSAFSGRPWDPRTEPILSKGRPWMDTGLFTFALFGLGVFAIVGAFVVLLTLLGVALR